MFRKIAVVALAALTLGVSSLSVTAPAEARNGAFIYRGGYNHWHGGGWGHRGWGHGGWGGNGWGGNGWGWGAAGVVAGLAAAPLFYGPGYGYGYGNGPGYYGSDYYYDGPVCSWERVRVRTPYGWRYGRQRVCY